MQSTITSASNLSKGSGRSGVVLLAVGLFLSGIRWIISIDNLTTKESQILLEIVIYYPLSFLSQKGLDLFGASLLLLPLLRPDFTQP
jgi:hypothetical protein